LAASAGCGVLGLVEVAAIRAATPIAGATRKFSNEEAGMMGAAFKQICGRWTDRLLYIGFLMGLSVLLFVLGSLAAYQNWPPAQYVRNGALAAQALFGQYQLTADPFPKYLWFPSSHEGRGVTRRVAERMQPGLTLYTSGDAAQAMLLDDLGNVIHHWKAPFSSIWPDARHVTGFTSDRAIYIREAHAFPNGDLLALYESPWHTPNGCGLAKLDRNSRLIWKIDANAHHDFDINAAGQIIVLTHEVRDSVPAGWEQLRTPFIEEFVTILTPDGRVVKRLSLLELLRKSPFYRPLVTHTDQLGDVLHSNTANLVGPEFAARHEGVESGDLLVCFRNLNLVAAVDLQNESIDWATGGPWRFPHDPDPLPDGTILIFDNCFVQGAAHGSRVLRFDARHGTVVWQYGGRESALLRSDIRSCQQLLANGNVLITESDYGRIIEVTPAGEIAWEYVHPERGGESNELIPIVSGARRYDLRELPFVEVTNNRHSIAGLEQSK
jgi:hypothetical protein